MSVSFKVLGAVATIAILAAGSASAQDGGAGKGGPPAASPGVNRPDRDQMRDQDRLRTPGQDRDRLRDQDPLYLGTQDRLRQHDQDRDRRISQNEFNQWHENAFNVIDIDNSGGFSLEDFQRVRLGTGPQGSARNRERVEDRAQLRKAERFRLMDGNSDGIVTRAEYMNFSALNYLDADANDDGRLSFQELQQFHRGW